MTNLTLGIIGTSNKENEYRLPIHPEHFPQINPDLRNRIFVEDNYGSKFGTEATYLQEYTAGMMSREALFEKCDIILLPKPTEADFESFKEGQILWGWPHCVQGEAITQVGIDKKMTYIAWEAMHFWKNDVAKLHVFHKNNELAGYCSVLHSLQLNGITGHYSTPKKVAVISFGSTARGAVHALRGQGYYDITIFTRRPYYGVRTQIPSLNYYQFANAATGNNDAIAKRPTGETIAMAKALAGYDIIVNCILQDTDHPLIFINNEDLKQLKPGTLIVDVSCDEKMGFDFAKPTSFEAPTFKVGNNVSYYAVDHSPSYLWNAATYEISSAVLAYIDTIMAGPEAWQNNVTIRKAIEIQDGVIQNPKILSFQKRAKEYPHKK